MQLRLQYQACDFPQIFWYYIKNIYIIYKHFNILHLFIYIIICVYIHIYSMSFNWLNLLQIENWTNWRTINPYNVQCNPKSEKLWPLPCAHKTWWQVYSLKQCHLNKYLPHIAFASNRTSRMCSRHLCARVTLENA